MKLEKTREALTWLRCSERALSNEDMQRDYDDARAEVEQAESLLREAAALKSFAVAGLSAFHGRLCSGVGPIYSDTASECVDPKCRAWAKAVQGDLDATLKELTTLKDGEYDEAKRDARNAALEEAATHLESMGEARAAIRTRALKRGG